MENKMNKFQCIVFALLTGFSVSALTQVCRFPPLVEGEHWDVFWAQHMVGGDLLRQELEKLDVMQEGDIASFVGIWDSGVNRHGEFVSQIIAGPKSSAIIPLDGPLSFQDLTSKGNVIKNYEASFEECHQSRNCSSYINNSLKWRNEFIITRLTFRLSDQESTLVVSAGNKGKSVSPAKAEPSLKKKSVIVASLTPSGYPSDFTSYGDAVTVSAPSDDSIRSYDYEGRASYFGGTSGAAPLVTGTLGGFSLLSRYHLSTHYADLLLRKTAIPLPNLPRNHSLGAGMLNAYKIGMVALRIQEQCRQSVQYIRRPSVRKPRLKWRRECISDLLENDETYLFDETSTQLFDKAMESFPECLSGEKIKNPNNCETAEAFNNLRRAFLLNPTDTKTLNAMVCVKKKYFRGWGTRFYSSLAENLQREDEEIIENICRDNQYLSWLTTFLSRPVLLDFIRQNRCSSSSLGYALKSLADISPSEESVEEILNHPNTNRYVLERLSSAVFLNAENLLMPQAMLEKIIGHSRVNDSLLISVFRELPRNFDKLSTSRELIEKIIDHHRASTYAFTTFFEVFVKNFDKFSNSQVTIDKFIDHPRIKNSELRILFSKLSNNADKLPNSQEPLEKLIDHPNVDNNILSSFVRSIPKNVDKLSNPQKLLEKIIDHPIVNHFVLRTLSREILNNAEKFSNHQKYVEKIIEHPNVDDSVLKSLSQNIANNREEISNHQEYLEKIGAKAESLEGEKIQELGLEFPLLRKLHRVIL